MPQDIESDQDYDRNQYNHVKGVEVRRQPSQITTDECANIRQQQAPGK